MSTNDPSPGRRRSFLNKLAVWTGIACAVVALTVVTFISVTNHHAAALVQEIRDRGEPACAADIEFDKGVPPSDWHERAQNFRAVQLHAVYVSPDADDVTDSLAKLEAWPEGRAALPTVREYLACIRSEPPAQEKHVIHLRKSSTSSGWFTSSLSFSINPHDWSELVKLCMDPARIDSMTACERKGLQALDLLNDPCVPVSLDACDLSRETGEQILQAWRPSSGRPGLNDAFDLMRAASIVRDSIPGALLRGDTVTAMNRVDAIFHAAESVRGLPWCFGHTCWMRLMSLGLDGCRLVLASHATSVDWSSVLRHLDGCDPRANLEHALIGDRALGIEVFEAARLGRIDPDSDLARMCADVVAMDMTGGADLSLYLEVMQEGIELSRKEAWGPTRGKRDWQRGEAEFPLWAQLSWGLLPWLDDLRFRTLEVQADLTLARIAIVASTKGADAAEQMAAVTPDPLDGKPMRSRRGENVLTLWSVGVDTVDDNGSSDELGISDFKISKHVFRSQWSAGGGMFRQDIVWRVRLHE